MLESLLRQTRAAADSLLVTLFPPSCGACGSPLSAWPRFALCEPCYEVLELNDGRRCERCDLPGDAALCERCELEPGGFRRLRAPFIYGGPLADLVVAAKFHGREEIAVAAARLLASDEEARNVAADATALVPVPLGRARQRERGYNQSGVIARVLGRAWQVPVRYGLCRLRNTAPQSDLASSRRRENVRGAFGPRGKLSGKVVLVDDVVTSGETARQATVALLEGGSTQVVVLAVARAVF